MTRSFLQNKIVIQVIENEYRKSFHCYREQMILIFNTILIIEIEIEILVDSIISVFKIEVSLLKSLKQNESSSFLKQNESKQ